MLNAAAQYRRSLEKKLQCGSETKKRLLAGFDQSLATYMEDANAPAMEDLCAAFGPPEEMAEVLMAEVTSQEQTQHRKNMLCKEILAVILAVILVVFTIYIWFYKEVGLTITDDLNHVPNSWSETYVPIEEGAQE